MPTPKHAEIAEAVKESINDGTTFSHKFVADRSYWYTARLERIGSLSVTVQAIAETFSLVSRQPASLHDYEVLVVVYGPLGWDAEAGVSVEDMDDYLLTCQEIKDHLRGAGKMSSATLIEAEHDPLYDQAKLEQSRFLAGLRFTYRIGRDAD